MMKLPTQAQPIIRKVISTATIPGEGIEGNACKAAGVSIDHEGEYRQAKVCGGIAGIACDKGHYCDTGEGQCQVADVQGVCKEKPTFCNRAYMPVCGCDGKTYGNACEAASSGVSINHQGECDQGVITTSVH